MAAEPSTHLQLVGGIDVDCRPPPHDLDAEVSVLSSLLIDDARCQIVASFLAPEHFYSESHRWIYEAILATASKGPDDEHHADIVRVGSWLKDRGRIAQVDGMAYLTTILNYAPAVANVAKYAETVYEKWRVRQTIIACQRTSARGYLDYGEAQEFIDGAAKELMAISARSLRTAEEGNAQTLARIIERLAKPRNVEDESVAWGLRTGIVAFDDLTHGMRQGQKITIVADTGCGKTVFAVQSAMHVARNNIGALIFETELDRDEMFERFVCLAARIPSDRWRTGDITYPEWQRIRNAQALLSKMPYKLIDAREMTIEDIRARALVEVESMRIEYGVPLGFIAIDYIQRVTPSRGFERLPKHERVEHATTKTKKLAQELKIPVLELAARRDCTDGKTRKNTKPKLYDAADCRTIEKEADVVVALWEPDPGDPEDPIRHLEMVMPKQRGGKRAERQIIFQADQYRFDSERTGPPPAAREHVDRGGYSDYQYAQDDLPVEET